MKQINTELKPNPQRICQDPKCPVCTVMDVVAAETGGRPITNLKDWEETHDRFMRTPIGTFQEEQKRDEQSACAEEKAQRMAEEAKRLKGELIKYITDHETGEHQGQRCPEERSNIIGYLIHGIRLTGEELMDAVATATEYMLVHYAAKARAEACAPGPWDEDKYPLSRGD